jgi:CDGSH iron-sulfur domain-containing protein 3
VVTIKVRQHGSYVVEGEDVRIVDWEGREYPIDRLPIALCRCGHSKRRPFCDGSHREAEMPPTPPAPDPVAKS